MSLFIYAIEVWAWCAYDGKYLSQMDRFCKRAFKYGYTAKFTPITDFMRFRFMGEGDHWQSLFSPWSVHGMNLRDRGHGYVLSLVRTGRFKRCFINRYIFNLFRFSIYMSYSGIYYYALIVNSHVYLWVLISIKTSSSSSSSSSSKTGCSLCLLSLAPSPDRFLVSSRFLYLTPYETRTKTKKTAWYAG